MERTIARLNIESFRRKLEDETDETKRQMLVRLLSEEQAKLAALPEESAGNIGIRPSVLALATPAQTSTVCQQNGLRDPGPDPSPTPHPVRARLALTPEPAATFLAICRTVPTNSSLFCADRATHIKIVAVSLVCGIVVALVGLNARSSDTTSAQVQLVTGVVKAGQPAKYAGHDGQTSR